MNLTLNNVFYCFARIHTILKASGVTPPTVFNGREDLQYPTFTVLIQVILRAVFSRVVQVLEVGIHGSIEVHVFQFGCYLFKNS